MQDSKKVQPDNDRCKQQTIDWQTLLLPAMLRHMVAQLPDLAIFFQPVMPGRLPFSAIVRPATTIPAALSQCLEA